MDMLTQQIAGILVTNDFAFDVVDDSTLAVPGDSIIVRITVDPSPPPLVSMRAVLLRGMDVTPDSRAAILTRINEENDKWLTHTAYTFSRESLLNYNMFHLAQEIYPDLGVIDGFTAMEGNGPVGGDPVEAKVALASTDPVALDALTTKIMGFDPGKIMYLTAMAEAGMGQGDLGKVEVVGTPVGQCQYKFKLNKRLEEAYGA